MDTLLDCSRDCEYYTHQSDTLGTCHYQGQTLSVLPYSDCQFRRTIDNLSLLTTSQERKEGRQKARSGPVSGQAGDAD
ncbi:MAG: hypothetical protein AABX66_03895 [Nanoarchaeota archaeon]